MGGVSKDLTGKRYGKLTVLRRVSSTNQGQMWECICDCGNAATAATGALNAGNRVSCGCIHVGKNSSRYLGHNDIGGSYWSQVEAGAKRRNIEFSVTKEQAWEIFESQGRKCALSGLDIKLSSSATYKSKNQTASLDRIDNSKGYILENLQWLHKDVNIMKNVHEESYFVSLCKLIAGANNESNRKTPL